MAAVSPLGARAQTSVIQTTTLNPVANLDYEDAEAWFDGFVPTALKAQDIAGAVVVVVKDGKILLSKGYGYSNAVDHAPVNPDQTLFRPGSISKLFTWTAIMQLVEQGKIGLDTDINTYLDFEVRGRDGLPITVRHLLTHRAGFEEGIKDLILFKQNPGLNARTFLTRWTPERIYKPGEVPAYSNYGAGLAGYIVERISGMPFETYVERNIFAPLAMKHTTFRQPLPAALQPFMSQGYLNAADPAKGFEYIAIPAAGSLSITGNDMAQFMIAHLQKGRLGSVQILKPETAMLMHDQASSFMEQLDSFRLGFYATNINGRRVISHGGNTVLFHSYLRLFIDNGVGIYISLNSTGKDYAQLQQSIFESFADRYFPQASLPTLIAAGAAQDAADIAGQYQSTRRSDSNFLAIGSFLGPMTITANADNSINVDDGKPVRYIHVGPLLWQTEDGKLRFGALKEAEKIRWVAGGEAAAVQAWEPFRPSQSPRFWSPLCTLALAFIAVVALAWPVAAAIRWKTKLPFVIERKARVPYRLSRLTALLTLLIAFGWLRILSSMEALDFPFDSVILLLQGASLIVLVGLFLSSIWYARIALADKRKFAALMSVALGLASLPLLWIAYSYGFFAFTTNY